MGENKFPVPEDIRGIVSFLYGMRGEMSDLFDCESRDRIEELMEQYKDWKAGGSEPDWDSFRWEINDLCRDDGMPILFPEVEN